MPIIDKFVLSKVEDCKYILFQNIFRYSQNLVNFLIHIGEATPSYNIYACTISSTSTSTSPDSTFYSNLNLLLKTI